MRPSSEQIDRAILDAAAGVFAVTGFAGTSVQKVADVVGYSKTGLLHRFPSKQALYDAVVAEAAVAVEGLLAGLERVPAGPGRPAAVVERVAAEAFARPGLLRLLTEATRPTSAEPGRAELEELAIRVVDRITVDPADPVQRMRTVLALDLLATAVGYCDLDPAAPDRASAQRLAAELATAVLGSPS